jgi:hypothetical protein
MNVRTILVSSAVLGLLAAGDAAAQKLSLQVDKGLVTLDAENVTVDEVLARWSQATGLTVISKSGEGSDIPVSLHLEGVAEREALRMVLRDLSGYIMGERRDPNTGEITIDRVMILPQSAAQAGPADTRPRRPFVPARAATALTLPAAEPAVDDVPVELAPAPAGGVTPGPAAGFTLGSGDGSNIEIPAPSLAELDEQIRAMRPHEPQPVAPPAAAPANPFGTSQGAATPGQMTPAAPPSPAEFIPPVTNPEVDPRAIRERILESQGNAEPQP